LGRGFTFGRHTEKLPYFGLKGVGQTFEHGYGRILQPPFKAGDVSPVYGGIHRQRLLREPAPNP